MKASDDKIGFWQRKLSYWEDVLLEKHSDLHQDGIAFPPLELYLRQGRLMLSTPTVVYSLEDQYSSYVEGLRRLPRDFAPVTVLILGFGLGSIAHILQRKHKLRPEITGLELDPRVLDIARRRLSPEIMSRTQLIEADAFDWMASCQERFDLIAVDLFIDTRVPEQCSDEDFLLHLKRALQPSGFLIFSRLDMENKALRKRFETHASRILPGMDSFSSKGNTLYLWRAEPE